MFYEPNEISAADKVTASSRGCATPRRAVSTPPEDISLAMTVNPPWGRGIKEWIDPKLAAVYVIGNSANSLCKIGYARDLRKRVLCLQGSSPVPVHLHHFVYVVGNLIAKILEADMHAAFGPERRHGEWFDIDPEEAGEVLGLIVEKSGHRWWDERGRRELGFEAAKVHRKDWDRFAYRGRAHD